jgi:hypothetical protein
VKIKLVNTKIHWASVENNWINLFK